MGNEQVSSMISGDFDPAAGERATDQQDQKQELAAEEMDVVKKEEEKGDVSDNSNTAAAAVVVAALHSAAVASVANAPPRDAETDPDTKTRLAISQIPINQHKPSLAANTYLEFPFSLDAHKVFLKEFQDNWGYGLRHDYYSDTRKIAIRMGTVFHSIFAYNVGDQVANDLRIRKYHPEKLIADFAAQIKQRTDSPVDFAEDGSWHSPDVAFAHIGAYYPGVVFEISFSEKKLPLQELAQQYFRGSDGEVQVVVGFDIEFPDAKKGKFMVWKKKETKHGKIKAHLVLEEEFQHSDGKLNKDCKGIYLNLADFCPARMIPDDVKPIIAQRTYLGHDTGIHIPAFELCNFLTMAHTNHQLAMAHARAQQQKQQA
ncbi:uncharacterized protein Z520_07802 [Fonsecaea multimorphosa CBS 102226]|uniref:Uncharacterized protein n=1 Tax=Fonsecaea multimorphosa CBS 102226 TaxID=1442371 RepID=A0A0D2IHM0_9EURO|nr:uncharacterized protein Z520_07802 [Fonsecaea multimorphosa CBS 102226]KIX96536.1 hypothetical protein Z520_07802 [Fonsecaea multimorphosa CBS 102226]OAL28023.1 hypothetical protein AYO22_03050 [Fonsecaea multimorphosa]